MLEVGRKVGTYSQVTERPVGSVERAQQENLRKREWSLNVRLCEKDWER